MKEEVESEKARGGEMEEWRSKGGDEVVEGMRW